jgi:uncharacterized membrane protein
MFNVLSVLSQDYPGLATYFFWGFIAPSVAVIKLWYYFKNRQISKKIELLYSIAGTVYFVLSGMFTHLALRHLWASI